MSITRSSPVQVAAYTTTYSQNPKLISTSWTRISVGISHVLALKSNNTLWAWGLGTSGQLGDGFAISRSSPVQVGNPSYTWNDISAGTNFSVGLRGDNLLFVWGSNTSGVLGDFNIAIGATRSSPVQVGTSSWNAISAGGTHIVAIRSDYKLFAWGFNSVGQLGTTEYIHRSSPVQIGSSSWSQISAGATHTTAITSNGKLFTWGDNTAGVLGYFTPVKTTFSWTNIAGNDDFTIAVRNDGLLFGWGTNANGQLGLFDVAPRSSPVQIGSSSWTVVSVNGLGGGVGEAVTAIRSDGTLWAWGYNATGGLGLSDTVNRSSPVQIGTSSWSSIASGRSHKLALKADGTMYAWGLATSGQLGIIDNSWRQISAGASFKVAIRSDYKMFAWGVGDQGQLGNGLGTSVARRSNPTQVGLITLPTTSWSQVSAAGSHVIAIDSLGKLYAWGNNVNGQLGLGDTISRSNPTQIGTSESFTVVSASRYTSAAITNTFKLYTWGDGTQNEIGDGAAVNRSNLVQVTTPPNISWVSVASGQQHRHAIDSLGKLYSWGLNNQGQLGLGDVANRSTPVQITTPALSWIQVSGSESHTVAIDSTYKLYGWGLNTYGQLGLGDILSRSSPTQVGTSINLNQMSWIQVSAGGHTSLFLRSDYTAWAAGYCNDGQFPTLQNGQWRSTPVQIAASGNLGNQQSWTQIEAERTDGNGGGLGISSDGSLWTWGLGNYGQLATNGTATIVSSVLVYGSQVMESRSSPVQIGVGSSWTKIGVGDLSSYAIKTNGTLWAWGSNAGGVLGIMHTVSRSSPTQIGSDSDWTTIFPYGATFVHAIRGNKLYAWGTNAGAQLGINQATVSRSSPVQLGTVGYSWSALAAYGTTPNTLGITTDGGLWAWGNKTNLLLGEFSNTSYTYSWAQISTGISHTAAIRTDGTLWTWGVNAAGQLGDNTVTDKASPVQIYTGSAGLGDSVWSNVSVFGTRTYAIRNDGTMWGWGDNTNYMLGDGTSISRSAPMQLISTNAPTSKQTAGSVYFEINTGGAYMTISPTITIGTNQFLVEAWVYPTKFVNGAVVGSSTSLLSAFQIYVITINGPANNHYIQIDASGSSNSLWYIPPVQLHKWYHLVVVRGVSNTVGVYWNGVRASADNNTLITSDGKSSTLATSYTAFDGIGIASGSLWAGYISNLRIVVGTDAPNIYPPNVTSITVPTSPLSPKARLASNNYLLTCQGWPIIDSFGAYTMTPTFNVMYVTDFSPFSNVQTVGSSFRTVSAGQSHALALDSNNKLWGWGYNGSKQLGNAVSWATISLGASHAIYLRSDGTLFGTGANDVGQLGDGTVTTRSSPVQLGAQRWNKVVAGANFNLGILYDYTLWSWGSGAQGQLGTGDTINRSRPVQISTSSWTQLGAGLSHSVAVRSDGILYAWGNNVNGQLGFGDTYNRYSPMLIGTGTFNSVYFNGSTDYLSLGGQANFSFSTGDWTIETWIYLTSYASAFSVIYDGRPAATGATNNYVSWGVGPTSNLFYYTAAANPAITGGIINLNTWYHVALSRVSSNTRMFINGVQTGATYSDSQTYTIGANRPTIGTDGNSPLSAGYIFPGYLSNLRVIKGQGLFTGTFTPSTTALLNNTVGHTGSGAAATISGTVALLTCQNATFIDNSGANLTITPTGTPIPTLNLVPFSSQVITATSWTNIFAGNNRTFGIQTNSTLWGWGLNTTGELGIGDLASRSSPVQVSGGGSWSSVATGTSHTLAISNINSLYVWGGSSAGQLGDGTVITKSTPVLVTGSDSWSAIGATALSSYALRIDGRLFVWGSNASPNNIGLGDTINRSSPVAVNTSSYTLIPSSSGSSTFNTVSDVNSDLWGWGENGKGQLGQYRSLLGDTLNRSSPVQIGADALTNNFNTKLLERGIRPIILNSSTSFTQISAGANHSLAIKSDGGLFVWGDNSVGQTGNSATLEKSWVAIFSSNHNDTTAFAMREDRTLWAWGQNDYGQLGTTDIVNRSSPVQVMTNKSWSHVSVGASYSVGITTDGLLWSWGDNSVGQLGEFLSTAVGARRSSPVQIGTFGSSSWTVVSARQSTTMAIRSDGTLWAWGYNGNGGLGDGTATNRSAATQIPGSWTTIVASATAGASIGIKTDGSLWTWGFGTSGQLGRLDVISSSSPVQVATGQSFVSVASMQGISMYAIRNDYTLWAWGWNAWGQLGIGTNTNMSSPVQVNVGGSVIQVAAGYDDSSTATAYFLTSEGKLFATGNNVNGALGDSTAVTRSDPVQVGSTYGSLGYTGYDSVNPRSISFTYVNAFRYGGYAIANTPNYSTLYAWGIGDQIQLGIMITGGTTARRSNPVQITTPATVFLPTLVSSPTQIGTSSWSAISAGLSFSAAITTDYKLFTWGDNGRLQLGAGISAATPIPSASQNSNAGSYIRNNDNALLLWGANDVGQLGNGTTGNASSPMQIGVGNSSSAWIRIARAKVASAGHTLGIRQDGTLWVWGSNNNGQLGTGTTINKSSPVQLGSATNWAEVATGVSHSLALKTDGSLWGWGLNTNGQAGLISWSKISAGSSHTLAIRSDGSLFAWGANTVGQLGDVTIIPRSSPVQIGAAQRAPNQGPFMWTDATAGINISAAIRSDGVLFTWGLNDFGQLGLADTTNRSSPTLVGLSPIFANSWTQVSARNYMVAIRTDGTLWGWGANTGYQLGNGTTAHRSSPVQIGTSSYTSVTTGGSFMAAIRTDGRLFVWGTNTTGQLGLGDTALRSQPTQIDSTTSWSVVSASNNAHTLAITTDGKLFSWGNNFSSQLGDNSTVDKSSPVQVSAGTSYTNVYAGSSYSVALKNDKTVWAWGDGTRGNLGIINPLSWVTIGGSAGIHNDYTLWVWGDNSSGQLGISSTQYRSSPVQIGTTSWTRVFSNSFSSFATKSDSTLWAWGLNTNGQLGLIDNISRSSPTQVGGSWNTVSIGIAGHTLGIDINYKLYAWGLNNVGQLGDGTTVDKNSPVLVGGATSSWTQVSAGGSFSMAIRLGGGLFTWGKNDAYQLGTGATAPRSTVTQLGASLWTQIASGDSHAMAIRTDSTLWSWGLNTSGQTGGGNTTLRSSPVQVGTSTWSVISAGNLTGAGITTLGSLQTWGKNNLGQLGSGVTTDRNAPVAVGALSWTQVSAVKDSMTGVVVNITNTITDGYKLYAWGSNALGQLGDGSTVNKSSPVLIGTIYQTLYSNPVQITSLPSTAITNNYSLFFDGANNIASVDSTPLNVSGGSWTVEFWMNHNGNYTSYMTMFSKRSIGVVSYEGSMNINNGNILFYNGTIYNSGVTPAPNTWHHVAYVYNGTNITIYLNGINIYSTAVTITNQAVPLVIGAYQNAATPTYAQYYNGYLSNFRLVKGVAVYTGNFTVPTSILTTTQNAGTNISAITGTQTSLLTLQNGYLFDNSTNQLALTSTGVRLVTNSDLSLTPKISVGESHTSIVNGYQLFETGDNTNGQLGDGTTVAKSTLVFVAYPTLYDTRSSPAQIGTGSWSQIAAGLNYSVALSSDSTLYTWGLNTLGVLGDGTTLSRVMPALIGTSSYTSISAGVGHMVALKIDNTLYAWGTNNVGQVGDNSSINRSSPVQVNTGLITSWNSVNAGGSHTLAIDATNNLPYGWGLNTSGQIGDNTLVNKSAPVAVTNIGSSNYSYQFNGTTQYLEIANNASNQMGAGDWTAEAWIYITTYSTTNVVFSKGGATTDWFLATNNANGRLFTGIGTTDYFASTGPVVSLNSWAHVALVRSGTTLSTYLNGVLGNTQTGITQNFASLNGLRLGRGRDSSTNYLTGYISNARLIKGTALYTTGFYPSTGALTTTSQGATASQVSLLTAQSATIVDNSTNAFTITNTGTVAASVTNPFGPYYSGSFNGTNQYLQTTNKAGFNLGTGDFTIEAFVYITSYTNANFVLAVNDASNAGTATTGSYGFATDNTTGRLYFANGGGAGVFTSTGPIVPLNQWCHIVCVRSSGTMALWLNGTTFISGSVTTDVVGGGNAMVGRGRGNSSNYFAGYISNLRLVKGVAVYPVTGSFTVPTNILRTSQSSSGNINAVTDSQTSLLLLQSASIIDNSSSPSAFTNNGTVTITTAYAPFTASAAGFATTWDLVQAGATHSMGFSNKTLYTWGAGTSGQLGDNTISTTVNKSAPASIGVAIYTIPVSLTYSTSPIQVLPSSTKSWSLVAAGLSHTAAMATDYTLWSWGFNNWGSIGDNSRIDKSSPVQLTATNSFSQLTAKAATLGIRATSDKLLYGWGQNDVTGGYPLGDGTGNSRSNPVQIYTGTMTSPLIPIKLNTVSTSSFTQVQVGSAATVIGSNGLLYTWGTNTNGQVGDYTVVSKSSPIQIGGSVLHDFSNSPSQVGSDSNTSYSQVSAGSSHTLAIDSTGLLFAWGKTPANGSTSNRSSPVQIGANSWLYISAGTDVSQAIDSTRTLYAWGLNTNYQLGSASFYLNQSVTSPVAIGTLGIPNTSHTNSAGSGVGGFIKNI